MSVKHIALMCATMLCTSVNCMRRAEVLVKETAMSPGKAVAYSLDTLQQRGELHIGPGDVVYEGMVVGLSLIHI